MSLENKNVWTLKEVSDWATEGFEVQIPALQRGLVWKPQQVELLWDSILRQFPIGAFTLSIPFENENIVFELLDGQQRANAISLGYGAIEKEMARSILWFDLKPEEVWDVEKTTRKYFIRTTTIAHPWGYEADDECSRFNTSQKEDALKQFGMANRDIYEDGILLSETYPYKSGLPIPLCWLLEAGEKSRNKTEDFAAFIKKKIDENAKERNYRLKVDSIPDDLLENFRPVFEAAVDYQVPTIYLKQSVMDEDSAKVGEIKTDIEVLFERIGTGGTRITPGELVYSAIKAYWPEIKDENDTLADKYMPPFTLVSLAFRLALSQDEKEGLCRDLSVKMIRRIASEEASKAVVLSIYKREKGTSSELQKILEKVDSWLTKDDKDLSIPPVLRTSIARTSPEVYLLLMCIAQKIVKENNVLDAKLIRLIRATAFYLHWMVDKGAQGVVVSSIYKSLRTAPVDSLTDIIKTSLMELYLQNKAIPLISVDKFSTLFGDKEEVGKNSNWRIWESGRNEKAWWPLWNVVSLNREMLIYAQRKYMCEKFKRYDPAKMDLWEDYNRPWDYDHIIPQDWIHKSHCKAQKYTGYCLDWKDNNGNMAAIPFWVNRSKSNQNDWEEYSKNKKELLVDGIIENYQEQEMNSNLTQVDKLAHLFAENTYKRVCRIYKEIYELLEPVDVNAVVFPALSLECGISERKRLFEYISEKLGGKVYYVWGKKEYPQEKNSDWAEEWMSAGKITSNGYYAAIAAEVKSDGNLNGSIEIGLRRLPESSELSGNVTDEFVNKVNKGSVQYEKCEGSWWHIYSIIKSGDTFDEQIVGHLNELAVLAEKELFQ